MSGRGKHRDRGPFPVGTVRVRESGKTKCRDIKVAMDGPPSRRWMKCARWWWLENKGPIPAGFRVLHRDGNSLNDDPSNLLLGTASDNVFIFHDNNPGASDANFAAMREGCREHNRLRGRIKRLTSWNESRWYPVDHGGRVIHNMPVKHRYKVYRAMGIEVPVAGNGDLADSAALGWPGVSYLVALTLAALVEAGGELDGATLFDRVETMRGHRGDPPLSAKSVWYSNMVVAKREGLVINTGRPAHREPCTYRISNLARDTRDRWTPVVPVRGSRLSEAPFRDYTKLDELGPRQRVAAGESLALLAHAIEEQRRAS